MNHNVTVPRKIAYLLCTMLGFLEFGHLTYELQKLIDFLIQHNVLKSVIKCSKCGNDVHINKETLIYRCGRRYYEKNVHKKLIKKCCNFFKSAKAGTWFDKSNLDVGTVCRLVACFLMLEHPRQERTQIETGIASPTTIVDCVVPLRARDENCFGILPD